jgi:hypothetical protein
LKDCFFLKQATLAVEVLYFAPAVMGEFFTCSQMEFHALGSVVGVDTLLQWGREGRQGKRKEFW